MQYIATNALRLEERIFEYEFSKYFSKWRGTMAGKIASDSSCGISFDELVNCRMYASL